MRTFFVLLFACAAAFGRVIIVPDSSATVQAGLNAAGYGDTVLVRPGVYTENITWPSVDGIKLYSEFGPDSTTLSGGGNGRVVQFGSGQSRATELRGFTVRAGKTNSGAGIYCSGSPTIRGNRITENTAQGGRDYGAGIYVAANAAPLIVENDIADNVAADSSTWVYGGGIHAARNSSPQICFNVISGNECRLGYWNYGAGIYIDDAAPAAVYGNVITGNANKDGDRGHGAGIYAGGPALIFCNLIVANENRSGSWNYGAGIKVNGPAAILNNTITSNLCTGGNWSNGGGIFVDNNETAYVKNNIIESNSAASGGGILCYLSGAAINSYNDVWGNTGGDYVNCTPGPGAISAAPQYVVGGRGLFYLSQSAAGQPQTSPCVDAGDTLLPALGLDLDSLLHSWTTRTDSVPDIGPLDLGLHYLTTLQVGLSSTFADFLPLRVTVSPNPARGPVRFTTSTRTGPTLLEVTDALGRVVFRREAAGARLEWDGRATPAGVYLYRVTSAGRTAAGRLVRLP